MVALMKMCTEGKQICCSIKAVLFHDCRMETCNECEKQYLPLKVYPATKCKLLVTCILGWKHSEKAPTSALSGIKRSPRHSIKRCDISSNHDTQK